MFVLFGHFIFLKQVAYSFKIFCLFILPFFWKQVVYPLQKSSSVHNYLALFNTDPLKSFVPYGFKTHIFFGKLWSIYLPSVNSLEVSYDSVLGRLWRYWKTAHPGSVIAGVLKSLQCYQLEMVGQLSSFTCRLAFVSDHDICWRITGSYIWFLVAPSDVCSYYFSSCTRFLDIEIHNHFGGWQSCGAYSHEPYFFA